MSQKFITHRTKLFITTSILPKHCYELGITNISFANLNCIYWEENEYNKDCCEVFSSFLKNRYGSRQRQKQQTTGRVLHAENFLGLIFLVVFLSLVEVSSVMCPFISQAMQSRAFADHTSVYKVNHKKTSHIDSAFEVSEEQLSNIYSFHL